ncbi:hypothetical protein SAY87_029077 [Trapa incisa]|uniref:Uncharacterized protein n=1 Tax=Trapa incisa TaxID=236973 RepID=A0AAN7KQ98_9MYRT|nr:hypothetical protein SAY87_029077 [Trapa incisa]
MSSFFSIGGRRGQSGNSSNYGNPDAGGDDDQRHHQVPPREISFWYDGADHGADGSFVEQCQQPHQQLDLYNYSLPRRRTVSNMDDDESSRRMMMMMPASGTMRGSRAGGICCQDCGNQAKKDCIHMRCRACCKSRGLDCPTHVKSTWVPASKRRERQQLQQQHQHQLQLSSPTEITPRRHEGDQLASSHHGLEVGNFPAELKSPAMFRCVRLTTDEGDDNDQYAYQTAVNIGGHVFKGILYDQGPDHARGDAAAGESSSGGGSGGVTQPLSLGGGAAESSGPNSAPLFDPYSSMYPPPFNPYGMAGTQFFPHSRS